jgi:hypothetical protein
MTAMSRHRPFSRGWSMGAFGHKRVLADDRSKAIKLLMFARLLKRMFEIDVQHCPNFGG